MQTEATSLYRSPLTAAVPVVKEVIRRFSSMPHSALALVARVGIGGVFWRSGQTKVNGWEITDSTIYLFKEEYALPLLPPELAAYLAVAAEHALPILLIAGLATRFGALGLLAMTAVIQIFVYPGSWPDHFTWAAVLLFLISRGPGMFSLDHVIGRWFQNTRT